MCNMNVTDSFIDEAAAFHGHLGPYLVLGVKMGLLARTLLNSDPFTTSAEVHTQKRTPYSCILDGIQFSSGCTLGKGNISVVEDERIYSVFSTGSATVQIWVKEDIIKELSTLQREELESRARHLYTRENEELFDVVT